MVKNLSALAKNNRPALLCVTKGETNFFETLSKVKIEQWDHRICDSVQGSSAASTTLELPGATVETVAALFLCFSQCKHTPTRGNPLVFAIYLVFVLHYRVVAVTKCGGEGKK